ncbi:hypothetical protein Mp_4g07240 [Marchantia polymorpha subsp. ruderalis]|uniref:Uncharacterized protein n=2 Tax=Marchantia polymorpha TaxID=3197 RepID=A0AAF6B7C9_MARPO|nr:hypothetical protein MARPO_0115s0057 [Marchantia polymorpha]BBN07913.1 hypothetical protein Mp_4g07240 [Marchantia polymorpha subsp. ruderalis]|eukprot:PTQ31141.1 hypothetical protein MARPO_0115s0057 [Marchantia polymorpha]
MGGKRNNSPSFVPSSSAPQQADAESRSELATSRGALAHQLSADYNLAVGIVEIQRKASCTSCKSRSLELSAKNATKSRPASSAFLYDYNTRLLKTHFCALPASTTALLLLAIIARPQHASESRPSGRQLRSSPPENNRTSLSSTASTCLRAPLPRRPPQHADRRNNNLLCANAPPQSVATLPRNKQQAADLSASPKTTNSSSSSSSSLSLSLLPLPTTPNNSFASSSSQRQRQQRRR